MKYDAARENIAIIKSTDLFLGGRGDDRLEVAIHIKGVSGPLAPFSAGRYYSLTNTSEAYLLEKLMIETNARNFSDLCGKVVKYSENAQGGVAEIHAIEGIYDNA